MRSTAFLLAAAGLAALPGTAWAGGELAPPVRVVAGEAPIRAEVGHAAPCFHDLDRDGKRDLLVGQMGKGQLLVWRNEGTDTKPVFTTSTVFRVDGKDATVEAG
ncbi:MAG: FG-GAP repeat domain-containing protein [Planctomycetota bacterium]